MRNKWLAVAGLLIAALVIAACGSTHTATGAGNTSHPTTPAASPTHHAASPTATATAGAAANTVKAAKVGGVELVTNSKGHTTYWFAPDTATTSKCNGSCASSWPPVAGPATAGSGVTGKLSTIKRSNGAEQATYNGHPMYTFTGDKSPGEATGNGVNAFGGLWHKISESGSAAPKTSPTAGHTVPGGY